MEETRKIGDYSVKYSMYIGHKDIALGENPNADKDERYMDIERVRTALKMLAPEERAIIQDFFFTESPIPVKELVQKYAMPKTSIYRKRDDALKKLKKILGNA